MDQKRSFLLPKTIVHKEGDVEDDVRNSTVVDWLKRRRTSRVFFIMEYLSGSRDIFL